MTWLVFLMGLVLAAAGAVAVYSGAPIIQIERGWAEVIAGSVAISGGVVTIAIGIVVAQISALRRVLRTQPAVSIVPGGAPVVEPALVELRPTHSPEDAVFVSAPNHLAAGEPSLPDDHSEGSRSEADIEPVSGAAAEQPHAATGAVSEGLAPEPIIHAAESGSRAPRLESAQGHAAPEDVDEQTPRRLVVPPSDLTTTDHDQGRAAAPLSRDWLTRPLLRARSARPPPEPALSATEASDPAESVPPPIAMEIERFDNIEPDSPGAHPSASVAPGGDEPAPTPDAAVIGRYQSGASSYTMYSDGAINVATEGGEVHRFSSMDELKAFIARQERALS